MLKNKWLILVLLSFVGFNTKAANEQSSLNYKITTFKPLDVNDKLWDTVQSLLRQPEGTNYYQTLKDQVKTLLDQNADPNFKQILYYAVRESNYDIVKMLLDAGANPNFIYKMADFARSPLHAAIYDNYQDIVQILLDAGANPNLRNIPDNQTPLHLAAQKKDTTMAQALLDKGANINEKDELGNTPLHLVRNPKMTEFLLQRGADAKIVNHRGETPLYLAAEQENIDVVNAFIAHNTDQISDMVQI